MALTNAERQARWRVRQREKLAEAQAGRVGVPLRNDPWAELFEAYAGGAEQWRTMAYRRPGDTFVDNALRVFRREKITRDDIIRILELTAFARMNDIYGRGRAIVDPGEPEWRTHRDAVAKHTTGRKNRPVT